MNDQASSSNVTPLQETQLAEAASEVRNHLLHPTPESEGSIAKAFDVVLAIPRGEIPELCVQCLLDIAQAHYIGGNSLVGLGICQEATLRARLTSNSALLCRALVAHGILQADTGDIPAAISSYAEGLELAIKVGDKEYECRIWNNIGTVLLYAAQYEEASECFEKVLESSRAEDAFSFVRGSAYGNIALACLHLEEVAKGLKAAKKSVEVLETPRTPIESFSRVLAETYYTRLLLEVDNLDKAKERAELAKKFAATSQSERAQLAADVAEGLYEVNAGLVDVGLSRLQVALERSRLNKGAVRDTLLAMVKAHEIANQPEKALSFLRELMLFTRKVQQENALSHHKRHLAQLNIQEPDFDPTRTTVGVLIRREAVLKGQVAQRDLLKQQIEMLERLAVTAELRDDSTGEHSYRVGRLASLLAQEYGCDDHTCFMVDLAARLHDIGKIGIPDGILLKPGRHNAAERQIMETHALVGAELLAQSNIPHMQMAEEIARHHHEWWDGSGYPYGISGTGIPIAARIAALADVFDALTHKRPYKEAWPIAKSLEEIEAFKGRQFDPELTDLFVALVRRLQREQGDLDVYLGEAAQESKFVQARKKIAIALRRSNNQTLSPGDLAPYERNADRDPRDPRFDIQR